MTQLILSYGQLGYVLSGSMLDVFIFPVCQATILSPQSYYSYSYDHDISFPISSRSFFITFPIVLLHCHIRRFLHGNPFSFIALTLYAHLLIRSQYILISLQRNYVLQQWHWTINKTTHQQIMTSCYQENVHARTKLVYYTLEHCTF